MLHLFKSESGSVVPVIGVLVAAMLGSSGAAVDTGRGQLVKAKLSSSLDAAGLAAASTVSTTSLETETTKYLNANFNGYMGAEITSVNVVPNADNTVFELSATAEVPTTFMRILGIETITVGATSEITRASSGLELVMVLDNTGSMSGSKLTSLKSAATTLVNILYGDQTTVEDLWIGLVPFSQAVNVGTGNASWLAANSFNWHGVAWKGCVDAREGSGEDITDSPPTVSSPQTLFPQYFWPDDGDNNWLTNGGNLRSGIGDTKGPNKYCPQAVTPMTGVKATILSGINAMTANGNTHIGLGAVWGWRMLSPRWQNIWGGEMSANGLPLAYNTPKMNKAVIVMTDGDNVISNDSRGAYWYLDDEKLGTDVQSAAEAQLDTRLGQVCTSMKNNNIIVYTISFGSISGSSQTMLRNCASQSDFYFPSPDSATLQAAFKSIGDSLSSLRISR
ncbi:MAG: pilus assembly protein TadG-related protein [Alphaproteobacteria bacterium]|nr:pilus assembly protein TadG-related protein [Alphaproteobacteria bacterium]